MIKFINKNSIAKFSLKFNHFYEMEKSNEKTHLHFEFKLKLNIFFLSFNSHKVFWVEHLQKNTKTKKYNR